VVVACTQRCPADAIATIHGAGWLLLKIQLVGYESRRADCESARENANDLPEFGTAAAGQHGIAKTGRCGICAIPKPERRGLPSVKPGGPLDTEGNNGIAEQVRNRSIIISDMDRVISCTKASGFCPPSCDLRTVFRSGRSYGG